MENNLEKEFVSYEQAVALKELGFNEPCNYLINTSEYYPDEYTPIPHHCSEPGLWMDWNSLYISPYNKHLISAPLKQQAFRWLRGKYFSWIWQAGNQLGSINSFNYSIESIGKRYQSDDYFNTYEEAENACIDKLIEIAKQQD